ncbi:GSCOCG00012639001-RA-CDS [Cotesia congregata]|nr:GSCOCG00012639001-RA-CDS [Cotesia congregata]
MTSSVLFLYRRILRSSTAPGRKRYGFNMGDYFSPAEEGSGFFAAACAVWKAFSFAESL